jgi:hypothetical protein
MIPRPWLIHRLCHHLARPLIACGLRRWAFRLHDATLPDYECWLWDLD